MFNEYMNKAIEEAKCAYSENEIPVGAVIVCNNKIISSAHNTSVKNNNSLCHAEMITINNAIVTLGGTYLSDCSLYVTKEPCVMCLGAIINARVKRIYFGAYDVKYGASDYILSLMYNKKTNHNTEIYGGIMENECKKLLEDFFRCNLS